MCCCPMQSRNRQSATPSLEGCVVMDSWKATSFWGMNSTRTGVGLSSVIGTPSMIATRNRRNTLYMLWKCGEIIRSSVLSAQTQRLRAGGSFELHTSLRSMVWLLIAMVYSKRGFCQGKSSYRRIGVSMPLLVTSQSRSLDCPKRWHQECRHPLVE
jgi:hypothetical protein